MGERTSLKVTAEEFRFEWDALLRVPLIGRPQTDEENIRFIQEAFDRLRNWSRLEIRDAVTEFLEAPACAECGRHSRSFPLWGELLFLLRRRRQKEQLPPKRK